MRLALGFKLPPVLKDVTTTCVGILTVSESVVPGRSRHVQAQEMIIVTDHSCSPLQRRTTLLSTALKKSIWKEN